jgi:hypothetical protein
MRRAHTPIRYVGEPFRLQGWNGIELPNFIRTPEDYLSAQRSFLVDFVGGRLRLARWSPFFDAPTAQVGFEAEPSRVPGEYRDMVGWNSYDRALLELREVATTQRFEVLVVAFEPEGTTPFTQARKRRGLEAARAAGFGIVDVGRHQAVYMRVRGILDYYRSVLTIAPHDPHPSRVSHAFAAKALMRELRRRGFVAVSRPEERAGNRAYPRRRPHDVADATRSRSGSPATP